MQVIRLQTGKRTRTTSELSTFLNCRRKYELRSVRRLRPKKPKAWSRWGAAFHKFDEMYHSGLSFEEALSSAREVFFHDTTQEATETWEELVEVAANYAQAYPTMTLTGREHVRFVRETTTGLLFYTDLLEVPFKVPIFTPGGRRSSHAEYAGIFDGIVEDASGSLWLYETKTTASLTEAFFDKLGFDRQVLRYVLAARMIFGDRVRGVVYNAVSKTPPRKPEARQDGTLSTAAVITTPVLVQGALQACREFIRERYSERDDTPEGVALNWGIEAAAKYLAHVLDVPTETAWTYLSNRVSREPAGKAREGVEKRIEKAKADQAKYREILESAERRLFLARRFREVAHEALEEVQWELYQLDRDIHLAEQDGRFFPNDRACDQMGGCEFRDYCVKNNLDAFEEAPQRHGELPPDGFLTPARPRPIRSALAEALKALQETESNDAE